MALGAGAATLVGIRKAQNNIDEKAGKVVYDAKNVNELKKSAFEKIDRNYELKEKNEKNPKETPEVLTEEENKLVNIYHAVANLLDSKNKLQEELKKETPNNTELKRLASEIATRKANVKETKKSLIQPQPETGRMSKFKNAVQNALGLRSPETLKQAAENEASRKFIKIGKVQMKDQFFPNLEKMAPKGKGLVRAAKKEIKAEAARSAKAARTK